MRGPRKAVQNVQLTEVAFEEPDSSIQAPRLFASQNRTWIAITGHAIDLKKVPGAEFVLLSIIARSGPDGISQPKLQKLSGQDNRSVPERTKQLQLKGYIDKRPIQDGKARTSLCTHKMFLKNVSEEPKSINDVFGTDRLNLTGMVFLLNKLLVATPVVLVRQLRLKMVSLAALCSGSCTNITSGSSNRAVERTRHSWCAKTSRADRIHRTILD